MSEPSCTAVGDGEVIGVFYGGPLHPSIGGDDQLGDALSGLEGEGLLTVVDQQNADGTAFKYTVFLFFLAFQIDKILTNDDLDNDDKY